MARAVDRTVYRDFPSVYSHRETRGETLGRAGPQGRPGRNGFRNGTVTAVGILLAFSLGFITHWAANPIPWQTYHLVAVLPILAGIALQMRALSLLLNTKCLRRRIYERANRIFMAGLIFTACGVGMAILLDFFDIATRSALPGAG